jgi:hypothetical protein
MERTHMAWKGRFKPVNTDKYIGDINKIVYRSSWEWKFMRYCDHHNHILEWSSEEIAIPYFNPVKRKKGLNSRYFPDFWIKVVDKNKKTKKILIEIKPDIDTRPPVIKEGTSRSNRTLKKKLVTYAINEAKWTAARAFCKKQGWEFQVMTEYDLGIKKRRKK